MKKESCRNCWFQGGYDNTPLCKIDEDKILELEIIKNDSTPGWCRINKRNKVLNRYKRLKNYLENKKR